MDDRKGVHAAEEKGLRVTGTLGILERAANQGLLTLADAFAQHGCAARRSVALKASQTSSSTRQGDERNHRGPWKALANAEPGDVLVVGSSIGWLHWESYKSRPRELWDLLQEESIPSSPSGNPRSRYADNASPQES